MVGKNAEKFIKDMVAGGHVYADTAKNGTYIFKGETSLWWEWATEDEDGSPCKLSLPCCYDHIDRFKVLLLDPSAWKAVGKTRGWYEGEYVQKAQDFVYRLFAEGRSIDDAL